MIAVLSTFFNPAGYQSRVENYHRFREALQVPDDAFYSVELSFNGDFKTNATFQINGSEDNILWQKESLLNYLIKQLPPKCTKICWVDSDLIFSDDDWLEQMESLLDKYSVAQGFSKCRFLDQQGTEQKQMYAIAFNGDRYVGVKGGCWGVNLSALPDGELMDWFAIGGGDGRLVEAWRGDFDSVHLSRMSADIADKIMISTRG